MPKVVLTYFNLKGLGEGPRLLLAYGGQEFEDRRIAREDWPALKPTTKYGQMPILEIDGKEYAQSMAISRYLGRKYGIGGANIEEDFEIDEHMDFFEDIRNKAKQVFIETDAALKEQRHNENVKNVYPVLLEKLNEIIIKNNGHIALGRLTWADFVFAGLFDAMKMLLSMPDLEKKYPSFKKVVDNVMTISKVKAFADAAPKTDF